MRHLPRVLLLALLAVEFRIPKAWACSCRPTEPETHFAEADAVYVAEVVSAGGFIGCASATFEVTEVFKGVEVGDTITRRVRLGLDDGACALREMPYAEGDAWLFYSADEDERISTCNRGSLASEVPEDLATLRALAAGETPDDTGGDTAAE